MSRWIITLIVIFFSMCSFADQSLFGTWVGKTSPEMYKYEFSKNNDFTYTHVYIWKWDNKERAITNISRGVWEVGAWTISHPKKADRSCNLTLYANSQQCCFAYKFISNNLILTNEYKTSGHNSMCANHVLIPLKE